MFKEKPPLWLQKPPLSADAQRIKDTITRLCLTDTHAAHYLGVPVTTFRNWVTGQRAPGAAVMRLLEVLGTIEVMNPVLHAALMPAASPAPVRRGRPPKKDLLYSTVAMQEQEVQRIDRIVGTIEQVKQEKLTALAFLLPKGKPNEPV